MFIYIRIIAWAYICFITKSEGETILWMHRQIITMTSQWARWCLKSPALLLFTQPFIRAQMKKTSKLRVTGLCEGNSPGTSEFPAQMASNVENVSIWWRHHDITGMKKCYSSLFLNASLRLHHCIKILDYCSVVSSANAIQNTEIETYGWLWLHVISQIYS